MLSAFARGALVLGEPRYLAAARRVAVLLVERGLSDGRLQHEITEGRAKGEAFLDDHAFLIAGLLDLFEADADARWLRRALALQERLDAGFADPAAGGYFFTAAEGERLLTRPKPDDDGALPAGNSVAALNLLRLAEYTGDQRYRERATGVLRAFGQVLARTPAARCFFHRSTTSASRCSGFLPISTGFRCVISPCPSVVAEFDAEPRKALPSTPSSVAMRNRPSALEPANLLC